MDFEKSFHSILDNQIPPPLFYISTNWIAILFRGYDKYLLPYCGANIYNRCPTYLSIFREIQCQVLSIDRDKYLNLHNLKDVKFVNRMS